MGNVRQFKYNGRVHTIEDIDLVNKVIKAKGPTGDEYTITPYRDGDVYKFKDTDSEDFPSDMVNTILDELTGSETRALYALATPIDRSEAVQAKDTLDDIVGDTNVLSIVEANASLEGEDKEKYTNHDVLNAHRWLFNSYNRVVNDLTQIEKYLAEKGLHFMSYHSLTAGTPEPDNAVNEAPVDEAPVDEDLEDRIEDTPATENLADGTSSPTALDKYSTQLHNKGIKPVFAKAVNEVYAMLGDKADSVKKLCETYNQKGGSDYSVAGKRAGIKYTLQSNGVENPATVATWFCEELKKYKTDSKLAKKAKPISKKVPEKATAKPEESF